MSTFTLRRSISMWAFVIPSPHNMTQREPYELGEAHSYSARCHSDPILFFLAGSDSEATHGTLLRSDAMVTRHFECERPGGRQDSGTLSYLEACFLGKVSLARAFTNRGWAGGKRKIAERVCRRSAPRPRGRILFVASTVLWRVRTEPLPPPQRLPRVAE